MGMIGSGSFKMKEYAASEFIRLEANKDYFDGDPKVDDVVFSNPDVLPQAIKSRRAKLTWLLKYPIQAWHL